MGSIGSNDAGARGGLSRAVVRRGWAPQVLGALGSLDERCCVATGGRVSPAAAVGLGLVRISVPRRGGGTADGRPVAARHGEEWLVAGGDDGRPVDHRPVRPAWVTAMRSAREAELVVRGTSRHVRVRRADAEQRERWWPVLVRAWPGYAEADAEALEPWDVWLLTPRN